MSKKKGFFCLPRWERGGGEIPRFEFPPKKNPLFVSDLWSPIFFFSLSCSLIGSTGLPPSPSLQPPTRKVGPGLYAVPTSSRSSLCSFIDSPIHFALAVKGTRLEGALKCVRMASSIRFYVSVFVEIIFYMNSASTVWTILFCSWGILGFLNARKIRQF